MGIHTTNIDKIIKTLKQSLAHIVPEMEIDYKAELISKINKLKKERNAVILGHNYMEPVLFYSIPDFVGDSLELARQAADTDKDIIVFCGVEFMAETAKILSPNKKVLLPAKKAGCSLAESITAEQVKQLKKLFPGVPVTTYINTYASVKAECDICITSGNASKIISSIDSDIVICLPDMYLAGNIAKETNKEIVYPDMTKADGGIDINNFKGIIGWNGKCEVHEQFSVKDIENIRKQFPDVVVLAHPECPPAVVENSDFSGSTSKMIEFVKTTDKPRYLLLTECSMADNIVARNPDKEMVRLCSIRCPHMNEITLEDTLNALENDEKEIFVEEEVRVKAIKSLEKMFELS
jgi:quinolinate synthase